VKKVLIVAYYFPPISASGSMRPLGFCRYLQQYGWEPRVLTTTPASVTPPQQVDMSLCNLLPLGLKIDIVPHPNPFESIISVRNRLREQVHQMLHPRNRQMASLTFSNVNSSDDRNGMLNGRLSAFKDLVVDWTFAFPDVQCFWFGPAVRSLSGIPRGDYPDIVFATGNPWTSFLVGKRLAERFRVPFIADFRDPWTGHPPYGRFRSPILTQKARQLERAVCSAASRVVANTEELRRQFCIDHPRLQQKYITITNGYDSDALRTMGHDEYQTDLENKPILELSHFGTVYGSRNPLPLFQAIIDLLEANLIQPHQLRLRFVGLWEVADDRCEALVRALELRGVVRREKPLPREKCLEEMAQSNVLLVLQADFPLQIPAKLYEYVASGRPILVIGEEGATANLVNRHSLGVCCPNVVSPLKELLWSLMQGHTQIKSPPQTKITQFHYRALTGELASVFDQACAEKSRL
jgi:glycosyltransferase involved in cell wall biosynthesis